MTKSWIQINGKLIPKEEYHGNNVRGPVSQVMPDIKPFISPIDGTLISSRPALKEHNRTHGVTNYADYSPEFLAKRREENHLKHTLQTKDDTRRRVEAIKQAIEVHRR